MFDCYDSDPRVLFCVCYVSDLRVLFCVCYVSDLRVLFCVPRVVVFHRYASDCHIGDPHSVLYLTVTFVIRAFCFVFVTLVICAFCFVFDCCS